MKIKETLRALARRKEPYWQRRAGPGPLMVKVAVAVMVGVVIIQVPLPVNTERMESLAYLDGKLELRQLLLPEPSKGCNFNKSADQKKDTDRLWETRLLSVPSRLCVKSKQRVLRTWNHGPAFLMDLSLFYLLGWKKYHDNWGLANDNLLRICTTQIISDGDEKASLFRWKCR